MQNCSTCIIEHALGTIPVKKNVHIYDIVTHILFLPKTPTVQVQYRYVPRYYPIFLKVRCKLLVRNHVVREYFLQNPNPVSV